jgi:hypothetical protein
LPGFDYDRGHGRSHGLALLPVGIKDGLPRNASTSMLSAATADFR